MVAFGEGITVDLITEMGTVVDIMAVDIMEVVITEVDIMEVDTTEDIIDHSDETGEKSTRMVALRSFSTFLQKNTTFRHAWKMLRPPEFTLKKMQYKIRLHVLFHLYLASARLPLSQRVSNEKFIMLYLPYRRLCYHGELTAECKPLRTNSRERNLS